MMLCMPLEDCDADHRAHHSDDAELEPCLTAKSIKDKDWHPGKNEENDSDAASGKVGCVRVGDASAFEKSGRVV